MLSNTKETYYQVIKNIKNHADVILSDYFGYGDFGFAKFDNKLYSLNKSKDIWEENPNKSKDLINFLTEVVNKRLPNNDFKDSDVVCWAQEKYNFDKKFSFFKSKLEKAVKINEALEDVKKEVEQDKKFIPYTFKAMNYLYKKNLMGDSKEAREAREYLYSRGLTDIDIGHNGFGLGFPEDVLFDQTYIRLNALLNKMIPAHEAEEFEKWREKLTGFNPFIAFGIQRQTNDGRYDIMRHRITIPITDSKNKVIAFSGRAFWEHTEPKYLNTRTHELWQKSNTVFKYCFAKSNLEKGNSKNLMIVEGLMDAIALNKVGVPAVAIMGVSCSNKQANLIKSLGAEKIYVALDNDQAGELNGNKVIETLNKNEMQNVFLYKMPENIKAKDFDEFINQQDIKGNKKKMIEDAFQSIGCENNLDKGFSVGDNI